MLQQAESYEAVYRGFRWTIPEYFNIGVDICDKWCADPARLALIHEKRDGSSSHYTFADIRRLSNQAANLFVRRGLRPGDRVGILLPQEPETAIAHVAAYKAGAIVVPLFTLFGLDALRFRLKDAGVTILLADARSLTAQARFTAWLVVGLPVAAASLAEVAAPGFLRALVAAPLPAALTTLALTLQATGLVAIHRIVRPPRT